MLTELKNMGLSDKEAHVYLAMLELGPSTMLEIAAKAGVNRPTAYVQIESLKKMGLVSTQTKGKKSFFIAESPSQLEHILAQEDKSLLQKKEELHKVMPDLMAAFNLAEEKPQVRFFEGKEGLLRMREEFLNMKSKLLLNIGSVDDSGKVFSNEEKSEFGKRRAKKNIHTKFIYTSKQGPIRKRINEEMLSEQKYLPPGKFHFSSDITIFDDNVGIASFTGAISGLIVSH